MSRRFPPYPGEDEEINPGIWGKRLAEFIVSKLPEYGVYPGDIYSEDWGWEIPIKNEAFPIFIGCGNQTEPGGNRFLCFIDPSKPQQPVEIFSHIALGPVLVLAVSLLDYVFIGICSLVAPRQHTKPAPNSSHANTSTGCQVRKGLFKKICTVTDVERVAQALDKVLKGHPAIKDLEWVD